MFGSLRAFDAIVSEENVCGPAITSADGARVWQSFDLVGSFLAIVAIADSTDDRRADHLEFDIAASASCNKIR
jgi:hypothetical protein